MGYEGKAAGAKKGDSELHKTNFAFLMNSLGVKLKNTYGILYGANFKYSWSNGFPYLISLYLF